MIQGRFPCRAIPVAIVLAGVAGGQSLVEIDGFGPWTGEHPPGWRCEEGAHSGDGPASRLEAADGALVLAGDASTGSWRYLTRPFAAEPGAFLRLRYEASLAQARVERFQFDSHFVSLDFLDQAGQRVARVFALLPVTTPEAERGWTSGTLLARVPPGAASAAIGVFLAHTGRLAVRRLAVEALGPERSFDVLVEEMARCYSHLAGSGVDWDELTGRYRERALAAADGEAFVGVLAQMLGELGDAHLWIETAAGRRVPTFVQEVAYNIDPGALRELVRPELHERGVALVGRTPEGFGYVGLGTFQCDPQAFAAVEQALRALFDAPGLLIDVRANGGGNEELARRIAGWLTDQPVLYSLTTVRDGPRPEDFAPPHERYLQPAEGPSYDGPVVCLTGPGCVSSCECFVQMMKALPHVTVVGQPTRGSSGNPAPVLLPNGVRVYVPRWVNRSPDGSPVEGHGVMPDVIVAHEGEGDPTLEAGLRELARLVEGDG